MLLTNGSRRTSQVAFVTVAGMVAAAASAEKLEIKRKFKPGSKRYLEDVWEVSQTVSSGTRDAKIELSRFYGMWESEERTPDGNYAIELTFDRVAQDNNIPNMGTHQYDTDVPKEDEQATWLKPILDTMVGKSLRVVVNEDLKVLSFSGMDKIAEEISAEADGNFLWTYMRQEFTNKEARKFWGEAQFLVYPDKKEVEVGETWQNSLTEEDPRLGKVVTRITCKLEDIEKVDGRESGLITYSGTVGREGGGDERAASAPELNGKTSGKAVYDIRSGKISRLESITDMTLRVSGPGMPRPMTIHVVASESKKAMSPEERKAQREGAAGQTEQPRKAEEPEKTEQRK